MATKSTMILKVSVRSEIDDPKFSHRHCEPSVRVELNDSHSTR